jgi:Tfp pilus assembly PilM family ATPase
MLDLKAQTEKLKTALGGRRTQSATDDPAVTEITVRPRRVLAIGRHLAFSIDDSAIQMAAVSHVGRKKRILDIRKIYIPKDLTGRPDRTNFIRETINEFLSKFGWRWARVSVTISGKETAFRTFFMPVLKKHELDSAVRFEAKKQIPFPLEDSIIDYRPIYKVLGGRQARYKIALQASTRELVTSTLEPFRQGRIPVAAVHHSHDVIGQLLTHLPNFNSETPSTVINITYNHSEISFYRGSNLEFFHISPVGSSLLGQQIDKTTFESFAETLSKEIMTSLDYYAGQYPKSSTDRIFVYGDLAYSSELLDRLNGHTGIELERFPTELLDFVPEGKSRFAEVLPVCLPVLASAVCGIRLANLLPAEEQLKQAKRKVDRLSQTFLILLALVLIVGWVLMKQNTTIAQNNLISLNGQVESFMNSEAYHTYNVLKRQIANYRAFIERTRKLPSYFNLNLKELSLLTPSPIRLFNLTYEPEKSGENFTIQGIVTSKEIPPEVLLAEYVEDLNGSPFFENVTLMKYVKRHVADTFEIEFRIDMMGVV